MVLPQHEFVFRNFFVAVKIQFTDDLSSACVRITITLSIHFTHHIILEKWSHSGLHRLTAGCQRTMVVITLLISAWSICPSPEISYLSQWISARKLVANKRTYIPKVNARLSSRLLLRVNTVDRRNSSKSILPSLFLSNALNAYLYDRASLPRSNHMAESYLQ